MKDNSGEDGLFESPRRLQLVANRNDDALEPQVYELELMEHLSGSRDVKDFFRRVKAQLYRLGGLEDWSHMLIESTGWIHEHAGTAPSENRSDYLTQNLYVADLMVRHARKSDKPLLQSTINTFIRSCPTEDDLILKNRIIMELMEHAGYSEYYNVPFDPHCGEGRAWFAVTTRGGDPEKIRAITLKYADQIAILGRAVDHVGSEYFHTHFPNAQDAPKSVLHAAPLLLLQTLANLGCSIGEAAFLLGISDKTAYNQMKAAYLAFGVRTQHGAITAALGKRMIHLDPDWTPPNRSKKRRG